MKRSEFYDMVADILEMPAGSIAGEERFADLERWDSLAVVSFIATCNGLFGVVLKPADVKACTSVPDLTRLVAAHVAD